MRVILGSMRSTPISIMLSEIDEPPLALRRQSQNHNKLRTKKLQYFDLSWDDLNIPFKTIIDTDSGSEIKDSQQPSHALNNLLQTRFPDSLQIFTDGSKDPVKYVSCASFVVPATNVNFGNMSENNINMLMKGTFISICVLIELSIYCALGEYLQSKSFLIAEAAYFIPWYELQCSEAKIIMLIIQRSQKPMTITAGKIFSASHSTLLNIIKTSLTYLSVLRASRL
ncbi:uncharacterized protein LOC122511327 [Leptopilina heterotoma]|uniref:uncharacterized protein LOC122511327 n=1 Tax=Leptopilina heterotoma TaxID=63436 RepID=UPI001CA82BBA|nr:uncharacterized protein LOC122511327 [Leptopilina heterotoma]